MKNNYKMSYIVNKQYKIAVAGTGYVGLSIATLLSQHHEVVAIDIVPEKVDLINNKKSPIQDDYIEEYLASHKLNLKATLDAEMAYKDAMPEAGPVILEPIHTLKAHVPNDNTGDIMGDVTKRRGRVLGMEPDEDGLQTIIAEVPLAELANFTTFIRQTTQGRGWFTTEFARYETLPEMLIPAVVEQARKLGNLDESADD